MNKMTIEEEMKLWDERSNDEFGKILKKIDTATRDYFSSWSEFGIEYNVLSNIIASYALDGNRLYVAKRIKEILTNYDILGNHKKVEKMVKNLFKLC